MHVDDDDDDDDDDDALKYAGQTHASWPRVGAKRRKDIAASP